MTLFGEKKILCAIILFMVKIYTDRIASYSMCMSFINWEFQNIFTELSTYFLKSNHTGEGGGYI